jgi:HK97 family phage prohead protease
VERLTFAVSGGKVEGRTLSGTAHVYGTTTEKYGGVRFKPGAFSKAIAAGRVASFAYHDEGKLLATQEAGTLRLFDDPAGLGFEIDLPPGVSYAEDMRALLASGVKFKMSFQHPPFPNVQSYRDKGVRVVTEANLLSVDPVIDTGFVFPAFDGTTVMLHSQTVDESPRSQLLKARARVSRKVYAPL